MIAVIKQDAKEEQVRNLITWLENQELSVHRSDGEFTTILGLVGDTSKIDIELIENLEIVEKVTRISEPNNANSKIRLNNTVVDTGTVKIAVVGLGLIGGSLAKAIKQSTNHIVYGYDLDSNILEYAKISGAVDKTLCDDNIGECDYIFICVYPQATIDFVQDKAHLIEKDTVVIDCSGIKRKICETCFKIAKDNGFTFIGGHPMAGLHHSGFKYATADLFLGASMILTPNNTDDIEKLSKLSNLVKSLGFATVTVTTPQEHDRIIAFTSQLAHVVSNAYVKSEQARIHKGFSAGSYKDLTRVARLNENMWSELFLLNKDNLLFEIDCIINSLSEYKEALQNDDADTLKALLKDGSDRKKAIDN